MSILLALYTFSGLLRIARYRDWELGTFIKHIQTIIHAPLIRATYVQEVLENPEEVKEVAKKLLSEPYIKKEITLKPILDREMMKTISQQKMRHLFKKLQRFIEYVKKREPRFGETLEILFEHVALQILWFLDEPQNYSEEMSEFLRKYENDTYDHVLLNLSSILLLKALSTNLPLWQVSEEIVNKYKIIVDQLAKVAEELESFTATFQLMRIKISKSDLENVGVTSLEELRRVLSYE